MRGISGGERSIAARDYGPLLGLAPGKTSADTWVTFTTSWQPDNVIWSADGVPLERKNYGQLVTWRDMKNVSFTRSYRPPNEPSHVSFSMWADGDATRAFGGPLDWSRSPFYSSFRELRRVLCDVESGAIERGPDWLYSDLAPGPASPRPPPLTVAAAALLAPGGMINRGPAADAAAAEEALRQKAAAAAAADGAAKQKRAAEEAAAAANQRADQDAAFAATKQQKAAQDAATTAAAAKLKAAADDAERKQQQQAKNALKNNNIKT